MRITPGIHALSGSSVVLAAVDFDHEARGITDEIYNEMINRRLPAKMESLRL